MTNKIKRLISILLVTVLFLLTIQPAFATGNKRKIDRRTSQSFCARTRESRILCFGRGSNAHSCF